MRRALVVLWEESLGIREGCGDEIFGDTLVVGSRNDNLNTTQTPECTKDKYNAKIKSERVSPKVPPTTYVGRRIRGRRCERVEQIITIKMNSQ
jgi:hypothetical protein